MTWNHQKGEVHINFTVARKETHTSRSAGESTNERELKILVKRGLTYGKRFMPREETSAF